MAALPNIGSVSWKAVTLVLPAVPQGGCPNPREINTFAPSEAQAGAGKLDSRGPIDR